MSLSPGSPRSLPPRPARMPHRRHILAKVDQHTWAKAENTVIETWVDVRADIDAINRGDAVRRGETYEINGRQYQVKPDGGVISNCRSRHPFSRESGVRGAWGLQCLRIE